MGLSIESSAVVALQATEGDVVVAGTTGQERRAILVITNVDVSSRQLTLHKYSGAGPGAQTDAVVAYQRSISPGTVVNYDTWLLGDQKITGLSDIADKITVDAVVYLKTPLPTPT